MPAQCEGQTRFHTHKSSRDYLLSHLCVFFPPRSNIWFLVFKKDFLLLRCQHWDYKNKFCLLKIVRTRTHKNIKNSGAKYFNISDKKCYQMGKCIRQPSCLSLIQHSHCTAACYGTLYFLQVHHPPSLTPHPLPSRYPPQSLCWWKGKHMFFFIILPFSEDKKGKIHHEKVNIM